MWALDLDWYLDWALRGVHSASLFVRWRKRDSLFGLDWALRSCDMCGP